MTRHSISFLIGQTQFPCDHLHMDMLHQRTRHCQLMNQTDTGETQLTTLRDLFYWLSRDTLEKMEKPSISNPYSTISRTQINLRLWQVLSVLFNMHELTDDKSMHFFPFREHSQFCCLGPWPWMAVPSLEDWIFESWRCHSRPCHSGACFILFLMILFTHLQHKHQIIGTKTIF